MREILFRGKRIDTGDWVEGYYALRTVLFGTIEEEIYPVIEQFNGPVCEVAPGTVGQYTGLTDKTGKKIFEGDLVCAGSYRIPLLIEFVRYSWGCTNKNLGRFYLHRLEDDSAKYEVVGNIHDSPELLEEGKW